MKYAYASLFFSTLILITASPSALADIYKFTDENGVTHFHNLTSVKDARYTLFMREGGKTKLYVKLRNKAAGITGIATTIGRPSRASQVYRKRFTPLITTVAKFYKVDESLLHAMIMAESAYNPDALSPVGAVGLMQLMPGTAKRYGVENSSDPTQNVHGGTRYIRDLLKMFNNDMRLAVAAYNCGENAVVNNGNKIPPYDETINYVARVLGLYNDLKSKQLATQAVALVK